MNIDYPYFDFHCDTITEMYKSNDTLGSSDYMVNIGLLKKYNPCTQVFAVYNDGNYNQSDVIDIINYLKQQCDIYGGMISVACDLSDIVRNSRNNIISALISIESLGSQKDIDAETVNVYYKNGVRVIGLCHNDDNQLCGGIGNNDKGLTAFGKSIVRKMQSLGVILDVSHMSDKSFSEATEEYTLPFVATHSNSRTVCQNPRNITDRQFVYLAKRGGLCGINFHPPFVGDNDITGVIRHIEHFMSLGGENNICLGSDFDGIHRPVVGLDNAGCVYRLFDALLSLNYNETLINKILMSNFHNFLKKFETLC